MNPLTLANMTPAERQECVGMWCDNLASTAKTPSPVVLACVQGECCWVLHTTLHGEWSCFPLDIVAPRFDLPRAWTPDGKPVPGTWDADEVAAIADNISAASHGFPPEWQGKLRTWAKRLRAALLAGAAALDTLDRVRDALTKIDRNGDAAWSVWERSADMYEQGRSDAYDHAHTIITEALGDTP